MCTCFANALRCPSCSLEVTGSIFSLLHAALLLGEAPHVGLPAVKLQEVGSHARVIACWYLAGCRAMDVDRAVRVTKEHYWRAHA